MSKKNLMLNESVALNFQHNRKVYRLSIGLEEGLLVLEELHKDQKSKDIKKAISLEEL